MGRGTRVSSYSVASASEVDKMHRMLQEANGNFNKLLGEKDRLAKELKNTQAELTKLKNERGKPGFFAALFGTKDMSLEVPKDCKASIADVLLSLDSEFRHIDRIGYGYPDSAHAILLSTHYLGKARDDWACAKKPKLDELDNIRKVAALLVRLLMREGAPHRVKSKTHPIPGQPETHAPR